MASTLHLEALLGGQLNRRPALFKSCCLNHGRVKQRLCAATSNTQQERIEVGPHCQFVVAQGLAQAGITISAIAMALLCSSPEPAFAYKGGGPYGSEVTRGLDLSGKDYSGRKLVKQDFKTSILRQANFKGATLVGASFFDANLIGADFSGADLRGVDLSLAVAKEANFTNANLEGALVTGNTSFKGATITGADFTDVPLRPDQREYLCKIADGVNPVTGNATKDTLLCQ